MENRDTTLLITVPVCSFRRGFAREYLETEEIPPPSTVYGFLLSLVGEEDRFRYVGTRIACAILQQPELSVILRTAWRIKDKKLPPGTGTNRRPDYQEILTGLEMGIWIQRGELSERLSAAKSDPGQVDRFGGLSLGESRDLVNDILWHPRWPRENGLWLVPDTEGEHPLPVWVDHVGSKDTIWQQFRLAEDRLVDRLSPEDGRWICILDKK